MTQRRLSVALVVAVLLVSGVAWAQTPADIAALRVQANAGDADAQFKLGSAYDLGQSVPQDYVQAVSWSRKAAEQGHAKAQYLLGPGTVTGSFLNDLEFQAPIRHVAPVVGKLDGDGKRRLTPTPRQGVVEAKRDIQRTSSCNVIRARLVYYLCRREVKGGQLDSGCVVPDGGVDEIDVSAHAS